MLGMKKYLPTREQLRETRGLKFLGDRILEPNLWHFNRYSLSFAFLVGGFWSFFPIPFQSIPCVLLCIWLRCNVPVAVAVVWISNPITMGPMFYFCYRLGAAILGQDASGFDFELSFDWLVNGLVAIWQPFLLGCLVVGVTCATLGYIFMRVMWHLHILSHLKARAARLHNRKNKLRQP